MTQIKICNECKKAFRPQYSDVELKILFITEEEVERNYDGKFLDVFDFVQNGGDGYCVPKQRCCEKCINKKPPIDNNKSLMII